MRLKKRECKGEYKINYSLPCHETWFIEKQEYKSHGPVPAVIGQRRVVRDNFWTAEASHVQLAEPNHCPAT